MMKIIKTDGVTEREYQKLLKSRSAKVGKEVTQTVTEILEQVEQRGDQAVLEYTKKFDGSLPQYVEVPQEVIQDALTEADQDYVNALLNAVENITAFHSRQVQQSFIDPKPNGVILGQRIRGLNRVGLYVPGGTAAYPSSVLMNAVPAKIAGVKEIIMVTPAKTALPTRISWWPPRSAGWTGYSRWVAPKPLRRWPTVPKACRK